MAAAPRSAVRPLEGYEAGRSRRRARRRRCGRRSTARWRRCATGHAGGVEVVAQRGARAVHLVGRDLLALTAAAEHDAPIGVAAHDGPAHRRAERRVVDRFLAVGAEIVDRVPPPGQHSHEVLLERISRVVAPDRDAHSMECTDRVPEVSGLPDVVAGGGYRATRGRRRRAPQGDAFAMLRRADDMCRRRPLQHAGGKRLANKSAMLASRSPTGWPRTLASHTPSSDRRDRKPSSTRRISSPSNGALPSRARGTLTALPEIVPGRPRHRDGATSPEPGESRSRERPASRSNTPTATPSSACCASAHHSGARCVDLLPRCCARRGWAADPLDDRRRRPHRTELRTTRPNLAHERERPHDVAHRTHAVIEVARSQLGGRRRRLFEAAPSSRGALFTGSWRAEPFSRM